MKHSFRGLVVAGLAAAVFSAPALASDPIGVYCIVERVVFEPSDCPERAQIWGACALATPSNGMYQMPSRGYLYYSIRPGQEEAVRAEWMDLKKVVGTGDAVGFGGRRLMNGRFRPTTENPASPDPYPLNMGVVRLGRYFEGPVLFQQLRDALTRR